LILLNALVFFKKMKGNLSTNRTFYLHSKHSKMEEGMSVMPKITNLKTLQKDPREPKVYFVHRMWLLYGFEWFWIILGAFFGILNGCTPVLFNLILGGLLDILVPLPGAARL
jgi:hypothetical protein